MTQQLFPAAAAAAVLQVLCVLPTYLQRFNAARLMPQLRHNLLPALMIWLALPYAQLMMLVPPRLDTLATR
jgi:hypothetical protein